MVAMMVGVATLQLVLFFFQALWFVRRPRRTVRQVEVQEQTLSLTSFDLSVREARHSSIEVHLNGYRLFEGHGEDWWVEDDALRFTEKLQPGDLVVATLYSGRW